MSGALKDSPKQSFQLNPRWRMGQVGIGPTKPVKAKPIKEEVEEVLPITPPEPEGETVPIDPDVPPPAGVPAPNGAAPVPAG
jgi:hypothetical protein